MSGASSRSRRGRGDSGVTIILFGVAMVGLLLMVALVVDLSNVRDTRQDNKATTDVAAAAGAQSLAPDGTSKPWRGACAALTYLQANEPSRSFTLTFRDGAGNPVTGAPCTDRVNQVCGAGNPTTWAWIRAADGAFVADIKAGYRTPDVAYPEDAGAYAGDNGVPLLDGCDQLAVLLANEDPALFGGVAGATSYSTTARSVARVAVGTEGEGAPAFLMLERRKCDVLSQQVGTGGGDGVIVEPASATEPGVIHLDSSGTDPTCGSGGGSGAYTLYSSSLGGTYGILAKPAGSTPGVISLRSLETMPSKAWASADGVSPTPTIGRLISRKVVDDKYNPGSPYAPTLSNVHTTAYVDAIRAVAPVGYTTVATCNAQSGTVTAARVFVNCPTGYSPTAVTFSAATDVIFNGPVTIGNGSSLFMPAAQRIVVGGNSTAGMAIANGGRLGINSGSFADTEAGVSAACTGREGPAWTQTAQLTIFGGGSSGSGAGGLSVTGRAALCQTFVYLAGPKQASNATYVRQAITDGSYDTSCTPTKPCPKQTGNTATNAHLLVSGYVKWSAPNQLTTQPPFGSVGFEDLALWTETATMTEVKSGGVLDSRGVLFLPNARTEMRSPASAVPKDAQFIGQSLKLLQGTLSMQPSASNSVLVPVLQSVGMVR